MLNVYANLVAEGSVLQGGGASLIQTTSITAVGGIVHNGSVVLEDRVDLLPNGEIVRQGEASLASFCSVNAVGEMVRGGSAVLSGSPVAALSGQVDHAATASVLPAVSLYAFAAVQHVAASTSSMSTIVVANALNWNFSTSQMQCRSTLTSKGNVIYGPRISGGMKMGNVVGGSPYETFSSYGRISPIDFGF